MELIPPVLPEINKLKPTGNNVLDNTSVVNGLVKEALPALSGGVGGTIQTTGDGRVIGTSVGLSPWPNVPTSDPIPVAGLGGSDQATLNAPRPFAAGDSRRTVPLAYPGPFTNAPPSPSGAYGWGTAGPAPVAASYDWSEVPNAPAVEDPTSGDFLDEDPEREVVPEPKFAAAKIAASSLLGGSPTGFAKAPLLETVGSRRFSGGASVENPVDGEMRPHNGIDIGAALGTPIYPANAGVVLKIIPDGGDAGNAILIDHGDGMVTRYLHMQSPSSYQKGDTVDINTSIGAVGTTGRSTGPHLHFELLIDEVAVDPMIMWVDALPQELQIQYKTDQEIRGQQRILSSLGLYDGEIDGVFGTRSRQAMVRFLEAGTQRTGVR